MASEGAPRVFLDTNVLFSGLRTPGGTPGRLLSLAALGRLRATVSTRVLDELARNIHAKAPELEQEAQLLFLAVDFEVVRRPGQAEVEPWAEAGFGTDAPIIAAALLAEVDFICTGDRHLLQVLPNFDLPCRTVSPAQMLAIIEGPRHGENS